MMRAVAHTRSRRPPSVRHARRFSNGTLVTVEHNNRGRVMRETYYWSSDEERLARIRERFENGP